LFLCTSGSNDVICNFFQSSILLNSKNAVYPTSISWFGFKVTLETRVPLFINSIIRAEVPDQQSDLIGYNLVDEFMVHGPCGEINQKCPCMKNSKCSKFFPKDYQANTLVGEDGFVRYRRRPDTGHFVERYGVRLDNRWVVPYNLALLK